MAVGAVVGLSVSIGNMMLPLIAVVSVILIVLGKSGSIGVAQAGFALGCSVSTLILLYIISYRYYSKKYRC